MTLEVCRCPVLSIDAVIDCNSLNSILPTNVKSSSFYYDAECDICFFCDEKKKKKISLLNNTYKHNIIYCCDNPDDCKIGVKFLAAVCKHIIISPGIVSLT